jgi:hypothetical protein
VARGTELERAIRYVREMRQTHVDAIALDARLRKDKVWDLGALVLVNRAFNGGLRWHREAIRQYDLVLKELLRRQL